MSEDLVCVNDVAREVVKWLWKGRIPRGKVTVLDGDPGVGKSTLTLTITAKVTTGSPFPDGACPEPADVILLSAEDEIADTIRPRLEAAGADLERCWVLPDVRLEGEPPRPPELPADLALLEDLVKDRAAALVVVDPIAAFLSGAVDMHRDQDVRRVLASMAYMAARTAAAVVIVRHMNKSGGGNPLYRGGGSIGIVGAARAGLLAAPDPDDDRRRVLAVTKSNLAAMPGSLAYRLVPDERYGVAKVVWQGTSTHTAEDLLGRPLARPAPKQEEAEGFLRNALGKEARPVAWLQKAAKDKGISWDTVKRAKDALEIIVERKGEEGRRGGGAWWWRLPAGQLSIKESTAQHTPDASLNRDHETAGQEPDSEGPTIKESTAPSDAPVNASPDLDPAGRPWPSREEWAKQHRTFYYDHADDVRAGVSFRASDYGTAEEIAEAQAALDASWRALGKRLREAKRAAAPIAERLGDDGRDEGWQQRYDALSEDEQRCYVEPREIQERRRCMRVAGQMLGGDLLPSWWREGSELPEVAPLVGRRQQAVEAAIEEVRRRVEAQPVDDAAWQQELERRAEVERYFREGAINYRPKEDP